LLDRRRARRQHDPGLLGHRVDVDVRRKAVRLFERADADEAHLVAGAAVVAPQCNAALRAAPYLLPDAALRWRVHQLRFAAEQLHAVGLDQRVQRESRARLALAPAAVTAMHEHRSAGEAIAHAAAGAAAV